MYLLGEVGGYRYQSTLWELRTRNRLALMNLLPAEIDRTAELMAMYRDTPMDFADASLVAVAESRSFRNIFSVDDHFFIYRLADGTALDVIR